MNVLSTHIEFLLLTHQCVVVPHFGAFMTMATPAARNDEENRFFPPLRMVRFNANITADDGFLLASVAHTYGLTTDEARQRVQRYVFQLRSALLSEGQVDFGSLGVFTQDEDGHIDFSACLAGAMTPALYGLDAFVMPRAERSNNKSIARAHRRRLFERTDSDSHITIYISRRALRRAITTAAAAVVCFLLCLPLYDSTNTPMQQAAILSSRTETTAIDMTDISRTSDISENQAISKFPKSLKSPEIQGISKHLTQDNFSTTSAAETTSPSIHVTSTASPRGYAVVLACATSVDGANDLIAHMNHLGYTNAHVYNNGHINRVVLDGYATESEALEAKHELQWHNDGFDDAWLLRP